MRAPLLHALVCLEDTEGQRGETCPRSEMGFQPQRSDAESLRLLTIICSLSHQTSRTVSSTGHRKSHSGTFLTVGVGGTHTLQQQRPQGDQGERGEHPCWGRGMRWEASPISSCPVSALTQSLLRAKYRPQRERHSRGPDTDAGSWSLPRWPCETTEHPACFR